MIVQIIECEWLKEAIGPVWCSNLQPYAPHDTQGCVRAIVLRTHFQTLQNGHRLFHAIA